jgi:hypothetical protein
MLTHVIAAIAPDTKRVVTFLRQPSRLIAA